MLDLAERLVICSVLEADADASSTRIEEAPGGCALVELRADCLRAAEVEGLVRRAGRALIVTARARRDGGRFDGSEEERRELLARALLAGARYVDVEWGGPAAHLARGNDAARVVLSQHGAPCASAALLPLLDDMAHASTGPLKIVPHARSPVEARALRDVLGAARKHGRLLAAFATGPAGIATRILGPAWGSWATYGAAGFGAETGEGQLRAVDLLEIYDVLGIRETTRRFALVGAPVQGSPSPAMHAAGYRELGIDARYLPVQAASVADVEPLAGEGGILGIEGMGVTIPLKEALAARVTLEDPCARAARAVNTVLARADGWRGFNTDGPAALSLLRAHIEPAGARVALAGAGGTARAIAASLLAAGSRVTFYNRDRLRAERAAREIGGGAEDLAALRGAEWEVLVQATPLGREGEEVVPAGSLRGRAVLDVVYGTEPTPLVRAARARGIAAVDGFSLLVEQALLQFELLAGRRPSRRTLEEAGRRWLDARSGGK